MNIAHFTNTYKPNVNGVVRSVSTFREALTRIGHTGAFHRSDWSGAYIVHTGIGSTYFPACPATYRLFWIGCKADRSTHQKTSDDVPSP